MTVAHPEAHGGLIWSVRRARAQVILCQGCCCGRTDRGFPAVPIERVKGAWKSGRLNRTIQLTVSGCVGPCDVANVAMVVGPEGNLWFGGLETHHYDLLIGWAERCHAAGSLVPVPADLRAHQFEWFLVAPPAASAAGYGPPAVTDAGATSTRGDRP